jgi:hypothetical protein
MLPLTSTTIQKRDEHAKNMKFSVGILVYVVFDIHLVARDSVSLISPVG